MRVKFFGSAAAAALAAGMMAMAAPASAQTDVDISFNAAMYSDYVFRGFSQSAEDAVPQGGVDLTAGGFYAGVWASHVDFGDDTDVEVDFYGGYRTEAAGFAWDGGVILYHYLNAPNFADYDYAELKLAVSRAVGPASVGAAIYYSPDYLDEQTVYYELNGGFTPISKLTVSGAVGLQTYEESDEYTTWNVGATYALTDNVGIDVRYHDTDVEDVDIAQDRVVAGVKFLF